MATIMARFRKAFDSGIVTTAMVCVLLGLTYVVDKQTPRDLRLPLRLLDLLCVMVLLYWQFSRIRRQRQQDLELQLALSGAKAQAEQALTELEQSRASLDMALRVGGLGVWRADIRMSKDSGLLGSSLLETPISADSRTREIFGLQLQEITYGDVVALWHPSEKQRPGSVYTLEQLQSLNEVREHQRIVRVDGTPGMIEIRAGLETRTDTKSGDTLISITGIAKDITEEEALKASLHAKAEEARQAKEAKGQFLAMMSHEIRTPLSGVLGMIDLVLDTPLADDQRQMLARSRESAIALLTIINDILDFSKVEAGKLGLESTPISLRSLLEDVCDTLKLQASHKRIALTYVVSDEVPTYVLGDQVRMRQILTNLINNALKFTAAGGVRVHAGRDAQGQLQLVVEDTGIGMSEATLQSLFQPFQQADVATTRRFGGTGLGLSIVKRLVDLMCGTITCESKEGEGSRFTVTLPFEPWDSSPGTSSRPDFIAQPTMASPLEDAVLVGARVLLAEDHPVNQELITRQLAKLGVACSCAEDGQEAWERLVSGDTPYRALLTDCHMPRVDGYELTRRIRAREAALGLPHLPIVALTANALRGERERCLALGMDAYLAKPLQLDELKNALRKAFTSDVKNTAIESSAAYGTLREVCAGDLDTIVGILDVFISSTSSALHELDFAVREGDYQRMRMIAHRIGSGCRQLDEARAAALLEPIELWGVAEMPGNSSVEILTELCQRATAELVAVLERASRFVGAHRATSSELIKTSSEMSG